MTDNVLYQPKPHNWLLYSLLLAGLILLGGHAGLLLAVPPSNASPLWPPTGIALTAILIYGYRVLPGVFLGAYAVHLSAFIDPSSDTSLYQSLLVGVFASGGSTLQAFFGAYLVRRFVSSPLVLVQRKDILRFILLGGMVACMLAPTIGTLALLQAGAFPLEAAPVVWGTWWVGDTLGVVIISPMILSFLGRPAEHWRPRRKALAIPLAISLALVIGFFNYATQQIHNRIEQSFDHQALAAIDSLTHHIHKIEEALHWSHSVLGSEMQPSAARFEAFSNTAAHQSDHVDAIFWFAKTPGTEEKSLQYSNIVNPQSCLKADNNLLSRLSQKGTNPASAEVGTFIQKECAGAYLSMPVVNLSSQQTIGNIVVLTDLNKLFDRSLAASTPPGTQIQIAYPASEGDSQNPLYRHHPQTSKHQLSVEFRPDFSTSTDFGNIPLHITMQSSPSFVSDEYNWDAWAVLSGGLLFSSLLSIGLLILTGHNAQTEDIVQSRTQELANEIDERSRTEKLLELQNDILQRIARDEPLKQTLDAICSGFEELSRPGTVSSVMLVDNERHLLRMTSGPSIPETLFNAMLEFPIGENEGSCGTAIFRGKQVICDSVDRNPEWAKYRDFALSQGLRACWSTPFFARSGQILGSFALSQLEERTPLDSDGKHMRTGSFLCSLAVEQAEANSLISKLSLAVEQSPSAVVMTDIHGKIEYVNQRFTELTQYTRDEARDTRSLQLLQTDLDDAEFDTIWKGLFRGHEWRGTVRHTRKDQSRYWAQCFLSPVRSHEGKITHVLAIHDDITEMRETTEKITYQATHDQLTGLLNRAEFERRLDETLRHSRERNETHTLCFIDLDQFKIVNDSNGHVAGDELLRQLGSLMGSQIRKQDVLARVGGDEFAIVFRHCELREAIHNAEKIRTLISEHPFTWEGRSYMVGMSAGLVEINENSPSRVELLREADAACYTAKETGRNRIQVYSTDDETTTKRSDEMRWSTRLREAISEDRLVLYQQQIIPLQNADDMASAEILVRMRDSKGQEIAPGLFLPAAERFGVTPLLDHWVVKNTLEWMAAHPDKLDNINYLALNLSGLSLDESFAEQILDWLDEYQIAGQKLCFEITETAAISNLALARNFISTLRERQVRFSLDDFGSGLSSFAYLKNLPVDVLKIDGQFVRDMLTDPIDEAMVKSINEIAQVMGKKTVAEFVENSQIQEQLTYLGIDYAQGYGIALPKPLEQA